MRYYQNSTPCVPVEKCRKLTINYSLYHFVIWGIFWAAIQIKKKKKKIKNLASGTWNALYSTLAT